MDQFNLVKQTLDKMGISYEIVEHPAAHTTEEADEYIKGKEGVRTKTMFMTNKKTDYYLLVMDDAKRLDFHEFQDLTDTKRIKMASSEALEEKMGLEPGVVSIFGLINNHEKDIHVYFDQAILDEKTMTFHPNVNTRTIFVASKDVLKFVKEMGYDYTILDLE
ncbi:prolyl-tRNA editing protein ProX [Lentilactobacillus sunkii]|jgi:Ala-tRNA(Pro) deacylase|uniref:Prolyl-tRNA editing protein ProX n=1 Tax=Lentilactobacillus sunkii TaxID=481719 RepID=A0A1E7XD92_9LACO|nr:prolyl-tRNA synthetase associated domain-containing protein [Lentilactobacillus sunkii]OFA11074.1 prolyl-tRNA editing protein ProX [Lentilactobacillus sunkii]